MKIEVMTWNTGGSPTMYGRLKRIEKLHKKLKEESNDVDIIALQELGSFKVGPVFYSLFRYFNKLFYHFPLLTMFWDYLMMLEGLIFPWRTYDNQESTIKFAKSLGYEYFASSDMPGYYLNGGLLILSKFPINNKKISISEGDSVHKPSSLLVRINLDKKNIWLVNNYLVPDLNAPKLSYLICNILNFILRKSSKKLRKKQIEQIRKEIKGKNVIVTGDFNIHKRNKEYDYLLNRLSLKNTSERDFSTFRDLFIKKHYDYILISNKLKAIDSRALHFKGISDHNPVIAKIEVN